MSKWLEINYDKEPRKNTTSEPKQLTIKPPSHLKKLEEIMHSMRYW